MRVKELKRMRKYYSWEWVKEVKAFKVFDHKKRRVFYLSNCERVIVEYLYEYRGIFTALKYRKDRTARYRNAEYRQAILNHPPKP